MHVIASTLATADEPREHGGSSAAAVTGAARGRARPADGGPDPVGFRPGTVVEGSPPSHVPARRVCGRPGAVGGDWPW
ncbi:hypothetical protein ACFWMJ_38270 [Streptomyces hawaiiensis]|uniref:hypothetical protein n=1 Tax=Streptomyces hawaiiensis TaxID=67305 RepID=UPI00365B469F